MWRYVRGYEGRYLLLFCVCLWTYLVIQKRFSLHADPSRPWKGSLSNNKTHQCCKCNPVFTHQVNKVHLINQTQKKKPSFVCPNVLIIIYFLQVVGVGKELHKCAWLVMAQACRSACTSSYLVWSSRCPRCVPAVRVKDRESVTKIGAKHVQAERYWGRRKSWRFTSTKVRIRGLFLFISSVIHIFLNINQKNT